MLLHNEISWAHGTGVQMARILSEADGYVVIRSFDSWGGGQVVEPVADFVLHRFGADRAEIAQFVADRLAMFRIRRILSIPYTREDVIFALTAKVMTGAPLTLWVMDDNTVTHDGIPRADMAELVRMADARFVISESMREIYDEAFAARFAVLPPMVASRFMRRAPSPPPPAPRGDLLEGVMVGNVWHQAWLDELLNVLPGSGVRLQWYTSAEALHFLTLDEARMKAAGLEILSGRTHAEIAAATERAPFVLSPSTSLSETDGHAAAIGRLSLPSKMPFVTVSAGTPFLVLANGPSGAADYVRRFDVGGVIPYSADRLREESRRLADPLVQRVIRERSFRLTPLFDITGAWRLLGEAAQGGAEAFERFDLAFAGPRGARSPLLDRL